jgi:alpha-galactosidase
LRLLLRSTALPGIGAALGLALGCASIRAAASPTLAPKPPLGWNSYDAYGTTIDEREFRANARWMSRHLKRFGWHYVVIDMAWFVRNPTPPGNAPDANVVLDANGRYIPAPNRFPSSVNGAGFAPLARYVHSLGLGFGIHILRGIPRKAVEGNLPIAASDFRAVDAIDSSAPCPWNPDNVGVDANKSAAQAYYDSVAALYASWGVDFIKADCIASKPYSIADIRMLSQALRGSGRAMVLSLSPGPAPLEALPELRRYSELWRISNDVWDMWESSGEYPKGLADIFALSAQWAPLAESGAWPDADMLAVGYLGPAPGWGSARASRLSAAEQQTLLTLWCISRSPLMVGANLTRMDAATRKLLTNSEVIAVDQASTNARVVYGAEGLIVWRSESTIAHRGYLAVFNIGKAARAIDLNWSDVGPTASSYSLRDLWQHHDLGRQTRLRIDLVAHSSALYRLDN